MNQLIVLPNKHFKFILKSFYIVILQANIKSKLPITYMFSRTYKKLKQKLS
jgi:hypothetical protein